MANLASGEVDPHATGAARPITDIPHLTGGGYLPIKGKLFGSEHVLHASDKFTLTKAAEEMSFGFSEKTETKTIRQRNVVAPQRQKILPLAEIENLFRSMKDDRAAQELGQISSRVISSLKSNKSPRRFLQERFSDPSKRYLAIAYALGELQQNGGTPHEIERLHDLLAEAEAFEGGAIRAGLNTVEVAAEFGAAEEGDRFRKVYRDAVIGYESFAATLDGVLTQFGDEGFDKGVRLLLKALAADLQAARPSSEPARLHAILQDLFHLKSVSTVLHRCRAMVERMIDAKAVAALNPIALTRDLLHVASETYVCPYHFSDLARKYGIAEGEPQVTFFTGAMGAMRSMPLKAFKNEELRFKAIDAVQTALDAILLEE
jgi:type III secretion protein W